MNVLKKAAASLISAACLAAMLVAPVAAQPGPPPPPREMMGPRPHPGCFFRHGHYMHRFNRWIWVRGHWVCR